ncbi:MAG TPA: hypothetical protein VD790_12340 [Thermoleophilaceae bacterium]|nr:hypothetical protein [Thermoleophilaceae bacterium]
MAAGTPSPEGHYVKRVVLPSGKTIEVVYFESARAEAQPGEQVQDRDLHVCLQCASELVYPTAWDEAGPEHWRVTLRCPNCEWVAVGIFSQPLVDKFDECLDEGTEQVMTDLRELERSNMSDEIDRFVAALDAEALLPEDF